MSQLTISQEFFSAGQNKDHATFTTKLSDLGQSIRNALFGDNKVASKGWKYSPDSLSFIKFRMKEDEEYQSYMQIREKGIYVPPGFNGQMVAFTEVLLDGAKLIAAMEQDYIRPIELQLSACLAQPDRFKKTATADCGDVGAKHLNKIYDSIQSYFPGTLRTDQATLSQVYARTKDIEVSAENLMEVLRLTQHTTPERMNSRAMVLSSLVDKLVIRMKQKPESFELHGMNAKVIGELTYTLARVFEYYAAMHNYINTTVHSLVDSFSY